MKRCALCGMTAFYVLGNTPLCKTHGDDHKRAQIKTKVPNNIRMAWSYWDGRQRCFHFNLDDVPEAWRNEAERVRLRIKLEWEGQILKAEVIK